MPEFARNGFFEAEKCLVNGLPTSATLNLVRCLGATVRDFHGRLLPGATGNLTWAERETALFELARTEHDLFPTINFTKNLRIDHRNPATHAEKEYDDYEAKRLWYLSVDAVTRMAHSVQRHFRPNGIA